MARTVRMLLVVAIGFASASAPSRAVVDQHNLFSLSDTYVGPILSQGQSFTVGISDLLTGIEISPLLDTSDPSEQIILVIRSRNAAWWVI